MVNIAPHFLLNSLADSFATLGYTVVAPDLFAGKPAPDDHDRPDLGFVAADFLNAHPPNITDPIIASAVAYTKSLGATRIGSAGYCFGGRYSFRAAAPGGGVDVVATAHPTYVTDEEIRARVGPATVAAGRECLPRPDMRFWSRC
jgi:dienelactone hydrolase